MDAARIATDIEDAVKATRRTYSRWTIGITNDHERRKAEHKTKGDDVKDWRSWEADSEDIARSVESYFIDTKKMKGKISGGERNSVFVYIF